MKTLIRLVMLVAFGLGTAATASADIYMWEDEDGTMHFTNSAEAPQNRNARMFVKAPPSRSQSVSEPETGNAMASDESGDETGDGRRGSGEAGGEGATQPRAYAPEPAAYRGTAPELGPRPELPPREHLSFAEETVSPEVEEVKIVEEEEIFTPSGYSPVDRYPGTHRWNDRYADRYPPFRAVGGGWNGFRGSGRRGGLSGAFYSGPSPYRVPRERNPNDRYLPSYRRTRILTYRRELKPGSGPPFSRELRQLERAPDPPQPWD